MEAELHMLRGRDQSSLVTTFGLFFIALSELALPSNSNTPSADKASP